MRDNLICGKIFCVMYQEVEVWPNCKPKIDNLVVKPSQHLLVLPKMQSA